MKGNAIPAYLTQKQNVIHLVVGTALFAELFILIFKPFGSGNWVELLGVGNWEATKDWIYLGFATLVVLVAMGVITVSRTLMYKYAKQHNISYLAYAGWIMAEIVAMAVIYTLFSLYILKVGNTFFDALLDAILYTACILLIPYGIFTLYFALNDKNRQLQHTQQTPAVSMQENHLLYNFTDDKKELLLSVRQEQLYYIEAADNYVIVHYENAGKMNKSVLRVPLKQVENTFSNTNLVRCHRSYIVNFSLIKILSKTDSGLVVDFGKEAVPPIPVTKTYSAGLLQKFTAAAGQ